MFSNIGYPKKHAQTVQGTNELGKLSKGSNVQMKEKYFGYQKGSENYFLYFLVTYFLCLIFSNNLFPPKRT